MNMMKKLIFAVSLFLAGSAFAAVSTVNTAAVSESGTIMLFIVGLAAFGMIRGQQ